LYKQGTQVGSLIDYFSAPNMLDLFNLGGEFSYDNTQFTILMDNTAVLGSSNIYNIQSFDTTFNLNFLDYKSLLSPGTYDSLETFLNDIKLITPVTSNVDDLISFFPERTVHFESFELSNLESDEGVFELLSTPDLKIFYPEPFVASPSFVHEDL